MITFKPFYLILFVTLNYSYVFSQITTNSNPPFNSPVFLVDSLLLGEGVFATNHIFEGDPLQIGFFNGENSNIGLDSGIIMGTGDILEIVPGAFGGFFANAVNDPDLLELASSVPGLIGQDFDVTSVNDVAILEFDFVPVSSYLSFKYVFASEEYFAYENTQFNDVFGFFISGPNIIGPYSSPPEYPNGSINIATFESTEANSLGVDLPITISSVNSTYNPALFVSNQDNGNNTINPIIDGFTTVITAEANVLCGETYHIRLAIADGTDTGLSSFVLLEAGSFSSPPLTVENSLDVDSNEIFTNCGTPITLTANVGGENFDFLWNTGETTQSISATPGYYWVQATDSTGCTVQSDSLRVYSQPVPEIVLPVQDSYCEGDDYLIDPIINSGTPPFNFDWVNFGSSNQITANEPGIYSLTITDFNGCSDTHELELFEQSLPEISYSPEEILVCGGIPVEVNAFGAENYYWTPDISISSDTGSSIEISTLSSITYTLEGVDSVGCSSTILVPTTAADDFSLDIFSQPVSCQGYSDGSIIILAENSAISPIQYSIDGGANYFDFYNFNNLDFGFYDIKVKDGIGCIISDSISVGSAQPAIQVLTESTNVNCASDSTGIIQVQEISGGSASLGYSYTWFNSGTDQVVGTDSLLTVPAGSYYLIVEDDNGCQATDEVFVTHPNPISVSYTKNDISCHGGNDGQIIVNVTGGGTPPYEFDWVNNGNVNSPFLFNLESGTYNLEITDNNDCLSSLSIDITESPTPLDIQLQNVNISCHGSATGSANVQVNGGTPPYFYNWSSGHVESYAELLSSGIYFVEVVDFRGCSVIDSVFVHENDEIITQLSSTSTSCFGSLDGTATISSNGGTGNLTHVWSTGDSSSSITSGFGEYWVIVEDELGCTKTDTIFINQPQKLRAELFTTDVSCYGGSDGILEATIIGGNPFPNGSFNFSWSLNNEVVGSNNNILQLIPSSNQPYVLNVSDYNGCQHTSYAFINQPDILEVDTNYIVPAYCLNVPTAELSVIASGGFLNSDGSYTFLWSSGETDPYIVNKNAGFYTVTVMDDNHCSASLGVEIPLEESFSLEITSMSLNCFDDASGSATVSTIGGYGPFTYNWNTSNGVFSEEMSLATSNTILNLNSGVTSVIVTDDNGCIKTTQTNIDQPDEVFFSVFKEADETCSGEMSTCDGEIEVQVEGGVGLYNVDFINSSNEIISNNQTDSIIGFNQLCSGFYQITVTDENGCFGTLSGSGLPLPVEIVAGNSVTSTIDMTPGSIVNNILCYGDTAISISVFDPNPSYTYNWYVNGEMFTSGLNVILPAGDIYVQAVSSPSCYTNSDAITISQPSLLSIFHEVEPVSCYGGNNGSISIEASGGSPSYSYNWLFSGDAITGSSDLSDLTAGLYNLTLTDDNDCQIAFDIEVTEPSELLSTAIVEHVKCNGADDGSASVSISGGLGPYSLNWQGVDSSALSAGTYAVIIKDINNCVDTIDVEINQPAPVEADFDVNQLPFEASASGGTQPYTYEWLYYGNYQSSGINFTPSESGEYTLVAIDANGCEGRQNNDYNNNVSIWEFDDSDILIYPNPVKDEFNIEIIQNKYFDDEFMIKIFDYNGKVVKEELFRKRINLNRNSLVPGVYFLVISSKNISYDRKILFE